MKTDQASQCINKDGGSLKPCSSRLSSLKKMQESVAKTIYHCWANLGEFWEVWSICRAAGVFSGLPSVASPSQRLPVSISLCLQGKRLSFQFERSARTRSDYQQFPLCLCLKFDAPRELDCYCESWEGCSSYKKHSRFQSFYHMYLQLSCMDALTVLFHFSGVFWCAVCCVYWHLIHHYSWFCMSNKSSSRSLILQLVTRGLQLVTCRWLCGLLRWYKYLIITKRSKHFIRKISKIYWWPANLHLWGEHNHVHTRFYSYGVS